MSAPSEKEEELNKPAPAVAEEATKDEPQVARSDAASEPGAEAAADSEADADVDADAGPREAPDFADETQGK